MKSFYLKVIGIGVILIVASLLVACSSNEFENNGIFHGSFQLTATKMDITKRNFEVGCIPDEETAIIVAKNIFSAIYTKTYMSDLPTRFPLSATFDEKNQVWLIQNHPVDMEGGALFLIIRKRNAEVVAIWEEK